jgi:RNA polymerase sigma-70 factor (ECF subfamily)
VLAVVYLIFNQGYGFRVDLAAEAIRLGHLRAHLLPDESEVHGLLALMLPHDARREARFADGELVLLADQDRSIGGRSSWHAGRRSGASSRVGSPRCLTRRRSGVASGRWSTRS